MIARSLLLAILTVGAALGAAHLMQSSAAVERQAAASEAGPDFAPLATRPGRSLLLPRKPGNHPQPTTATLQLRLPAPPAAILADLSLPGEATALREVPADTVRVPPSDAALGIDGFGMACDTGATATVRPGAMLRIEIAAGCLPGAVAVIRHAGLVFALALGPTGQAAVDVPAMARDARVSVRIGEAAPIELRQDVPDADQFDRVALVGGGVAHMSIHALEFGAGPGSDGHVSAARVRTDGGRVFRLGDPALETPAMAEVYSYPSGRIGRRGTVRLSVAVRVTAENCGGAARVRSVQAGGGAPPTFADLTVPVPDCDGIGTILVLKNLVEDLKIARN